MGAVLLQGGFSLVDGINVNGMIERERREEGRE